MLVLVCVTVCVSVCVSVNVCVSVCVSINVWLALVCVSVSFGAHPMRFGDPCRGFIQFCEGHIHATAPCLMMVVLVIVNHSNFWWFDLPEQERMLQSYWSRARAFQKPRGSGPIGLQHPLLFLQVEPPKI